MSERVEDLIIGGGAIGVCVAYNLARRGRRVVLLERDEICSGCSHGNAGWVTPCHATPIPGPGLVKQSLKWMLRSDSPFYIKPSLRPSLLSWLWKFSRHCNEAAMLKGLAGLAALHRHVVPETRELVESLSIDCEFQERGLYYVFDTEKGLEKGAEEMRLLNEAGIPGRLLDRDATLELEPVLKETIRGSVFYDSDADFVPDRYVKEIGARLPAAGVEVREQTSLDEFRLQGRRIESVVTSSGRLQPDNVVLAAGSWSIPLARRIGIKLPIEPGKGYSVTMKRQSGSPSRPIACMEAKVGVTPWKDSIRLAGTMEIAGFGQEINQVRVDAIVRGAQRFLPDLELKDVEETWVGLRPVCCDGLPIIGRSGKVENLFLATGHGMLGLTQAAVTARLIGELVAGEQTFIPAEPYSPDRFS
jgi:D-amino-acid dehydrogenase